MTARLSAGSSRSQCRVTLTWRFDDARHSTPLPAVIDPSGFGSPQLGPDRVRLERERTEVFLPGRRQDFATRRSGWRRNVLTCLRKSIASARHGRSKHRPERIRWCRRGDCVRARLADGLGCRSPRLGQSRVADTAMLQRGMTKFESASQLSNAELLADVASAAQGERHATARLVVLLAEVDARRLYLGEGCSSLFTYCTQVLHLSEHAAYGRIEAARAARRFPIVLDALTEGALTLTAVTLLAPHLTPENHRGVLTEAGHKSKRDVEHIVARLRPQPAVAATVRKLPPPTPAVASPAPLLSAADSGDKRLTLPPPPRPATVTPLAPERYKVQFTVSRDTHDKLRRVQDLLRHSNPDGDPAAIFDRALTVLLADLEKTKLGAATRPHTARRAQSGSRHIPAAVRREVWKRDGGQCAFVGVAGRCTERGFLEFHHVRPYADGGATVVENLELRCRAHNVYEAEQYFGGRWPLLVREDSAPFLS